MPNDIEMFGEKFTVNDSISEFDMMEFAEAAADGMEGQSAMASMLRLVRACIVDDDWARFRAAARKHKAAIADLTPVVDAVFKAKTERPTGQLSDSSDGLPAIEAKPESNSDAKVSELFPGRPDKQYAARAV
jgi:hypothetical protein